jgi:N utilization substance protein B
MAAKSRHNARRLLVQALYQAQISDDSAEDLLEQFAESPEAKTADMKYFSKSLPAILVARDELNVSVANYGDIPAEQLDPVERAILWLGMSELINNQDIPPKVAINEAVKLAKTFGAEGGYRYINALLDKAAKALR